MKSNHASSYGLVSDIRACTLCAERFALTASKHRPRPVPWFDPQAQILIAGQAPGMRVQEHPSGRPFVDRSGDRLRDWLGVDEDVFYDKSRIAVVPMAFCFPGYNAKGADLPPPPVCRETWHEQVMAHMPNLKLILPVGLHAQRYHMGVETNLTETVSDWQKHAPRVFPLPHPSWRNTGWLKKHPWFEAELLPALRHRVQELL
jgi:uracil-DNA glycosylase family 4